MIGVNTAERDDSHRGPYYESYLSKYARIRPNDKLDFDFKDYIERRNLGLSNRNSKKVLMLTNKSDFDSAILGINLIRKGIDYVRLNIEDIPLNVRYLFKINTSEVKHFFMLNSQNVDLDNIGVVWLRDFNLLNTQFSLDSFEQKFLTEQWTDAMSSLQRKLKCTWINSVETNRLCDDKIEQLIVARNVGFQVPHTIVTNEPCFAKESMSFTKETIVKILHHHDIRVKDKVYTIRNQRITHHDFSFMDSFGSPFIIQELIKKKSEIRVTFIGEKIYATELSLEHQENIADIHDSNLNDVQKSIIKLPNIIEEFCLELAKLLGLKYGSIDLIKDQSDQLFFLEVNALGDWYWIEKDTKQDMTHEITKLLQLNIS